MNFLRRELAPIGQKAWAEIDAMAKQTLAASLAGRKFVDIDGPHGLDFAAVPVGRLTLPKAQDGAVRFGVHEVQPLVEARADFKLGVWELDDIERGSKTVEFDALIDACREIAAFEDRAIIEGFGPANIVGIEQAVKGQRLQVSQDAAALADALAEAQAQMLKDGVAGPADLVVSASLWKFLSHSAPGGTIRANVESQIGGRVIYSDIVKDALLLARRGGDLELTVGQDFAIGYHGSTATEVSLFVTESFTFRVLAPEAVVGFALV